MIKALIDFSRYSDGDFQSKVQTIITSMTENPLLPNPIPTVSDITEGYEIYTEALDAARMGNHADVAVKNARRKELTDQLRSMAANITSTANGDRGILLTSGFNVSKEREPVVITKPENLQVSNGLNSGQLHVSVTTVKGAKSYVHEYATPEAMNADTWQAVTSTMSKITFNNLEKGKNYYCRVAAVGAKGQIVYTDPVSRIVV